MNGGRYEVIVVGGGAAGMIAAGRAAELGKRVLLLEKNTRLGEKLRISGGGRCNIFNAEEDLRTLLAVYGDAEQYLYSAFAQFGRHEAEAFFERLGVPVVVEERGRAFPKSQKAATVVRALEQYMEDGGVEVRTRAKVADIEVAEDGSIRRLILGDGTTVAARSYIFATGGVSHPETGSTGDGFPWLRKLGHTVAEPNPSIVPLRVKERWIRDLSGASLPKARVTFRVGGEKRLTKTGRILFTHFGLSGPTILNAAKEVGDLLHEGAVTAHLDLFPGEDLGAVDRALTAAFAEGKNQNLRNRFKDFAPPGFGDALLARIDGLDLEQKVHSVSREDRKRIGAFLKDIPLTIVSLMGYDRAVVADGGAPLGEVDTKTLRSKKAGNLFLTGDLLHIARPSGGYSLQLCWTTGYLAGENA